jgi:hypothetical protein
MKPIEYSKQQNRLPDFGVPCKTICNKETVTSAFFVKQKYLDARKNASGRYVGFVPGAGGDAWWVEHEDKTIGAYLFDEVFDL